MTIRIDLVTPERIAFSGDVDMVVAPGIEGEMGILARHAPLMTILAPGEVKLRRSGVDDEFLAVGGGFMEVRPDKVTILAESAEHASEIDIARAEAARQRAQQLIASTPRSQTSAITSAEMALRRSNVRLGVARRRRTRTN